MRNSGISGYIFKGRVEKWDIIEKEDIIMIPMFLPLVLNEESFRKRFWE